MREIAEKTKKWCKSKYPNKDCKKCIDMECVDKSIELLLKKEIEELESLKN